MYTKVFLKLLNELEKDVLNEVLDRDLRADIHSTFEAYKEIVRKDIKCSKEQ